MEVLEVIDSLGEPVRAQVLHHEVQFLEVTMTDASCASHDFTLSIVILVEILNK